MYLDLSTKWLMFSRQHFEMHYLEKKVLNFDSKFVLDGPVYNKSALVQVMALLLTGDKPLSNPMMTQYWLTRPQWVKYICVMQKWTITRKYESGKFINSVIANDKMIEWLLLWKLRSNVQVWLDLFHVFICRIVTDHVVYVPSQWETMLHCNVVSHWLGTYTKWSQKVNSVS